MPEAVVTVRHCPKATADIEICYDTHGDKENGEPLVLVAGLGQQLIGWPQDFVDTLVNDGFYVIRLDNRDVGKSSHLDQLGQPNLLMTQVKKWCWMAVNPKYDLKDMAHDVVALMDKLEIPSAHICGISMGGMISQELVINWPDRVRTLTCLCTSSGDPKLPVASLGLRLKFLKPAPTDFEGRVQHNLALFEHFFSKKWWDKERVDKNIRIALNRCTYRDGVSRQINAISGSEPRHLRLEKVEVPTLVMHGKEDPLVPPANGQSIAKHVPNATLKLFDDWAHDLCPQMFEPLSSAIREHASKAQAFKEGEVKDNQ
eukprot:TRINITY_DN66941_c2_g10_i1.p1 TRINITY_DN66941_c2_g10~~TRINITY_DN66941_c2_g10_i1.p1  ORF type:complete len:322 (+),score=31.64 TRINITY_DN66941_c2_g10_i1:23-967(+)